MKQTVVFTAKVFTFQTRNLYNFYWISITFVFNRFFFFFYNSRHSTGKNKPQSWSSRTKRTKSGRKRMWERQMGLMCCWMFRMRWRRCLCTLVYLLFLLLSVTVPSSVLCYKLKMWWLFINWRPSFPFESAINGVSHHLVSFLVTYALMIVTLDLTSFSRRTFRFFTTSKHYKSA